MTSTGNLHVVPQHPPAVKVGGRRLSVSRPKLHSPTEPIVIAKGNDEPTDYPRPSAPGEEHPIPPHRNHEEEPLRKEKRGSYENEKKLRELMQRKEAARTKDASGGKRDFGAAGRIAQPAGKGFAV